MPIQKENISSENNISTHSEEVNEIITAVPSWILRRGILVIFTVCISILLLSALIRYPDVVKARLKINSLNSPKGAYTHQSGKLVKILVSEGQMVKAKESLAFIESTGNHEEIIKLSQKLKEVRSQLEHGTSIKAEDLSKGLNLGELHGSFQSFYQEYLQFLNTQNGGLLLMQREYLLKDLNEIKKLRNEINEQKKIQQLEYDNAVEEYETYKRLRAKSVISNSEFKQQQNKFLSSKYPLQQTTMALVSNSSSYTAKQKELIALETSINEQKGKFLQALNSMDNQIENWLMKFVVFSPIDGEIGFSGILQENQNVNMNQELFVVNPGNTDFFGEVNIPQFNLGKVNKGQKVLIKLRSYPFEEYGMIKGKVSYITDFALRDSVFVAKIDFEQIERKDSEHEIVLKQGMIADIEIITKEATLLQRFLRNMTKIFEKNS